MHRLARVTAALACTGALVLVGCNDADEPPSRPAAAPTAGPVEFPRPDGRQLAKLARLAPAGPVIVASQSILGTGRQRFAFGLYDRDRRAINRAPVALYVQAERTREPARGPYLAQIESLVVDSPFRSQSSSADPDAARSVYVAKLPFPRAGRYRVLALARIDGRLVASDVIATDVGGRAGPPAVGDPAIRVHTPTEEDAGGDITTIDTRVPPSSMHADDFADVLGRKPVLLLFATPLLCRSRVCGPVVDIAEQVKAKLGDKAAFIHMEIYEDNRADRPFRPQVRSWRLPTEPWAFAIDRHGTVVARFEGAFSPAELERAMKRAIEG